MPELDLPTMETTSDISPNYTNSIIPVNTNLGIRPQRRPVKRVAVVRSEQTVAQRDALLATTSILQQAPQLVSIGYRQMARAPATEIHSRTAVYHITTSRQLLDHGEDRVAQMETRKDPVGPILAADGNDESFCVCIVAAANHNNLLGIERCRSRAQSQFPDARGWASI